MQILRQNNLNPEIRLYLDVPPTAKELESLITMLGDDAEGIIRKKEKIYLANFGRNTLTGKELISALVKYPILIERPIIIVNQIAIIGRDVAKIEKFIN